MPWANTAIIGIPVPPVAACAQSWASTSLSWNYIQSGLKSEIFLFLDILDHNVTLNLITDKTSKRRHLPTRSLQISGWFKYLWENAYSKNKIILSLLFFVKKKYVNLNINTFL